MNRSYAPILGGALLILAGLAFLLNNFGILDLSVLWAGLWIALFIAGGLAFLLVYFSRREQWWALIPGFTLLGIGGQIAIDQPLLQVFDFLDGAIVVGSIGLAFLAIYAAQRQQWWALIPGGILASVAAMILFDNLFPDGEWVIVMFLGMAATFALVALLPTGAERNTWAFIPAGIFLAIGLLVFTPVLQSANLLLGVALLLGGGFLLVRSLARR
ncbi:MAG: hypothetical protein HUU23_08860 [Caldilineales bacterium]|nr:hypothetical protein [Caldilineales bacterium]